MPERSTRKRSRPSPRHGRWQLRDAKARFDELVRLAREKGPQRVSVSGKDAVVVVDAAEWDRLQNPVSGRDLVEALARSALRGVPIERVSAKASVRDVKL